MRLSGWLVFRTQAREAWTLNVGRLAVFLLPTPLLLLAWVLFRHGAPLRALAATGRVRGRPNLWPRAP
jgi:hypothetical protein